MESVIAKLGTNYIISAFIPTLGFVLTAITIFEPIIPDPIAKKLPLTTNVFSENALIVLVLTLILAFIMSGLMIFFFKVTEGYYILVRFPRWRRRHQREAHSLQKKIQNLEELIRVGKKRNVPPTTMNVLRNKLYYLRSVCEQKYPSDIHAVLPTRFGNILRAAETHANTRYGIDAVPMWPRLAHVIPDNFHRRIQESNNSLTFLVNSMVLTYLLAILCLSASGYQCFIWQYSESKYHQWQVLNEELTPMPNDETREIEEIPTAKLLYFIPIDLSENMQTIYSQRAGLYFVGFLLFVGGGMFFYYASLTTVFQYGEMIRSAYDLFRFDLLKHLHLPMPKDTKEEFRDWRVVSELISIGRGSGKGKINLSYVHDSQGPANEE